MPHLSAPEIALLVSGVLCVGFAVVGTLVSAVVILFFVRRRRRASPAARADVLAFLGYQPTGDRGWSMPLYGTTLVFDDGGTGWRWTVRLPRYNTLTLQIEERASGTVPEGRELLTENPVLDARLAMGAERSAQSVALVTNRAVGDALLAVPWVSLRLRGDELVLEDPALRGLAKLGNGAKPGTANGIVAEGDVHRAVVALVSALFDSLYSKETGTLMPEHR